MKTVRQIAAFLKLEFRGDGDCVVSRVSGLDAHDGGSLVFLDGDRGGVPQDFAPACVITTRLFAPALPDSANIIYSQNPKLDFATRRFFCARRMKAAV